MQRGESGLKLNVILFLILFSIILIPFVSSAQAVQFDFSISDIVYQSTITSNGANIGYTVTATSDGNSTPATCSPSPGSLFPVGATTVTCSATVNQITSNTSFIITVSGTDSIPPNITTPPNITAYQQEGQTDPLTFVNIGEATATDNVDSSPFVTNNYPDSLFPLGNSTVTWMAIDHSGNSNIATQTVTVKPYVATNVYANPPGGIYNSIQNVELVSSDSNTIYYTVDGTNPTTSSAIYSSPIPISSSITIKFFEDTNQTPVIVTESYAIDVSPPVITIIGSNPATVLLGNVYTDDGATATDNLDGDITSSIVTTNNVNTSSLGTYNVIYNVQDSAGNYAGTVFRTVQVISGSTITHMSDTTSSSGQSTYSGRPIHAEYVSASSQLVGDSINTMTVQLRKSGTPTGLAEIGVFNSDLSTKMLFSTLDVSTVAGSYADYTFSLPSGQSYTIQADDRIGVKYTGGDSTNYISVMRDIDAADPFDGTNAYHTYYTTSWASYTDRDLYMTLVGAGTPTGGDTTPPVITLLGSNPESVQYNSSYVDIGATATDDTDGDLTSSIVTSNPVDTSVIGAYTVTYNVDDSSGNAASQVTRTVNVVDNTIPTVLASPPEGLYNSTQNITLTASDPSIIYYTTNGDDPTTSSPIYNSPISVGSSKVLKFFAKTLTGNSGPITTATYTIDTISPVITINGNSFETVDVFSTYVDAGATANDNLDGNLTSSIVTTDPVDTSVLGTYTVTYNVFDSAGNSGTATRTVGVVDQIPPVITVLGLNPTNVNLNSTYVDEGATALDNYDGDVTSSIIVANNVDTSVIGNYTVTYNVKDSSENQTPEVTRYVNVIDGTAPITTAFPAGGNYTSTQLVMLTSSDPDATIYFTTDETTPDTTSEIYSSYITISQNTTLKFFAVDLAENVESVKTEVYTIDSVAPTTTASPAGGNYSSAQQVTLTADEIATIYYELDAPVTNSSAVYTSPIPISNSTTLNFFAVDTAGNTESAKTEVYTFESNNPPTANAGNDQTVVRNSLVTLDGSASFDLDSDGLTFEWTQISGQNIFLSDSTSIRPTFTAPNVGPNGKIIEFQLVVNDGKTTSIPDYVIITVTR